MIALRDVLVRPGILDSERVCALPIACQLFFRNLLHACDGAARFPADPDELRAAFYWRSPGVSRPHVESWLQRLHRDRLVKLYTRGGRPYGELFNYGQKDTRRKVLYPPPDEGELNFAAETLPADEPQAEPAWLPSEKEMNRREGKARGARQAPPRPPTDLQESPEQWLARIAAEWPLIDVRAELAKAVRKRGAQGVERTWFVKHWLPGCSAPAVAPGSSQATGRSAIEPEPEAWRVWLEDAYPGNAYAKGGAFECTEWRELPADVRAKIAREMSVETR